MPVPLSGDANRKGSRVAVRELAKQIVDKSAAARSGEHRPSGQRSWMTLSTGSELGFCSFGALFPWLKLPSEKR